nr:MAG TPA: hypothetical protein [Caudoviricetes sp.]
MSAKKAFSPERTWQGIGIYIYTLKILPKSCNFSDVRNMRLSVSMAYVGNLRTGRGLSFRVL